VACSLGGDGGREALDLSLADAEFVLGIPGDDLEAALGGKDLELISSAVGILLVDRGSQIGATGCGSSH
jgi:hypothetical protein